MAHFLPIAVIQSAPLAAATAIEKFSQDTRRIISTHPNTMAVVCPELHLCGTTDGAGDETRQLQDMAEPLDGSRGNALAKLAQELGIWLLPGSVCERGTNDKLYNTSMVYSPEGRLVASYRKIFPWLPFEPYDSGDRFVIFDIPEVGRIGLAICYDLWFPEVARNLAWMGAELIVYPTQTTTCDREQELVLAKATAIQNQVYILSCNAAAPVGTGRSLLVDPEGIVRIQAADAAPTVLTDVLDLNTVSKVRQYGTCGLNRMWFQLENMTSALQLPVYAGSIDPIRWRRSNPQERERING